MVVMMTSLWGNGPKSIPGKISRRWTDDTCGDGTSRDSVELTPGATHTVSQTSEECIGKQERWIAPVRLMHDELLVSGGRGNRLCDGVPAHALYSLSHWGEGWGEGSLPVGFSLDVCTITSYTGPAASSSPMARPTPPQARAMMSCWQREAR
jgi:hypothetical protein